MMPRVHVRALRYLVAVAEEGHFGRAAERLHVSQPSVSQAVARLERQFGARLLDRRGGRVTVTPVGETVLADVRAALAHLDAARAAVTATGRLRVGVTPFAAMWLTAHLITPFREANPDVEVLVSELDVTAQARALLTGELDIALGEPVPAHERLRATAVREDRLVVWVAADHRLAAMDAVPLAALADVALADGDPDVFPTWAAFLRQTFAAAGIEPRFAAPFRDAPSAISRILDGSVVTLAVDILAPGAVPGLVARPLAEALRWSWVATERDDSRAAAQRFVAWATGH